MYTVFLPSAVKLPEEVPLSSRATSFFGPLSVAAVNKNWPDYFLFLLERPVCHWRNCTFLYTPSLSLEAPSVNHNHFEICPIALLIWLPSPEKEQGSFCTMNIPSLSWKGKLLHASLVCLDTLPQPYPMCRLVVMCHIHAVGKGMFWPILMECFGAICFI